MEQVADFVPLCDIPHVVNDDHGADRAEEVVAVGHILGGAVGVIKANRHLRPGRQILVYSQFGAIPLEIGILDDAFIFRVRNGTVILSGFRPSRNGQVVVRSHGRLKNIVLVIITGNGILVFHQCAAQGRRAGSWVFRLVGCAAQVGDHREAVAGGEQAGAARIAEALPVIGELQALAQFADGHTGGEVDLGFAGSSFFSKDLHDAITRQRSVNSGGGGSVDNLDPLDIVRVDVDQAVLPGLKSRSLCICIEVDHVLGTVVYDHPIYNVQRVGRTIDGAGASQANGYPTRRVTAVLSDQCTHHFSGKGAQDIAGTGVIYIIRTHG